MNPRQLLLRPFYGLLRYVVTRALCAVGKSSSDRRHIHCARFLVFHARFHGMSIDVTCRCVEFILFVCLFHNLGGLTGALGGVPVG